MSISVYPRWRGEHAVQNFLKRFNCGLSPLARGTHTPLSNSCDLPTVYPRWRGEHIDPEQQYAQTDGLSPLARGTLPYRLPDIIFLRFIPAGAGNTCCSSWWSAAIAVYPRWRGEHNVRLSPLCVVAGLSPLARGTLHGFGFLFDGRRFIPAGAGNTYIRAKNKATATVYPRWRGEHTPAALDLKKGRGLSPLARGTLHGYASSQRRSRFIPAGAGNTPRLFKRGRRGSVYPRWRGEHDRLRHLAVADQGLSPLARGTQRLFPAQTLRIRFIPAGAGNTIKKLFCVSFRSVYHRWRGEHPPLAPSNSGTVGLSPLARGTHVANRLIIIYFRFIPAGAGNTLNITYY